MNRQNAACSIIICAFVSVAITLYWVGCEDPKPKAKAKPIPKLTAAPIPESSATSKERDAWKARAQRFETLSDHLLDDLDDCRAQLQEKGPLCKCSDDCTCGCTRIPTPTPRLIPQKLEKGDFVH